MFDAIVAAFVLYLGAPIAVVIVYQGAREIRAWSKAERAMDSIRPRTASHDGSD